MFKVYIREFERGWGNRVDEVKTFDTFEEASTFCKEFNAQNTSKTVPDWYMRADM